MGSLPDCGDASRNILKRHAETNGIGPALCAQADSPPCGRRVGCPEAARSYFPRSLVHPTELLSRARIACPSTSGAPSLPTISVRNDKSSAVIRSYALAFTAASIRGWKKFCLKELSATHQSRQRGVNSTQLVLCH
ncbi:hypothetical protein NUW54_g13359 [Trametes sanguinea]|uniref:Uncharacterized protein n=1 Tax=Trametes sanguinea TaxID=158606 RepID=A0ACC1MP10_9APHY|nr:hypothetical protein NUW54_g13359 [Trametes sanguinea]